MTEEKTHLIEGALRRIMVHHPLYASVFDDEYGGVYRAASNAMYQVMLPAMNTAAENAVKSVTAACFKDWIGEQ